MDHLELLRENAQKIIEIGRHHGAINLRIFGSVARGDFNEKSDFDFMYSKGENRTPWFPGGLKVDLEELLGIKVDVVSDKALKDKLKKQILTEAIPLCDLIKKD